MATMSLFDVSLCRAGVADKTMTHQVEGLLKSRTFLEMMVFSHLAPSARRSRANTVLMLANGCECSPRTLGEHFSFALKWFDCAITQALFHLRKMQERALN